MRAAEPSCSFLPVVQRDSACARVSVYIGVASSALRRSLTRDWDLLMGRIWSRRSEPVPLHFCSFSGAFTHLSPNALLSRALMILIHTRMCAACLTVSTLSRNWGDLIDGYLAPCVSERIISKMKLLLVAVTCLQTWQFRFGPAGLCAASGDNLRGRRLGFAWSLATHMFWRLQTPRKRRLLIEQPHLTEGGENVGWRGGKVWANIVVRTSQPVLDIWGADAAQRVTDSEQNHPGAGMKHASAWVWHSSSRGYWCMYGITHELIHFSPSCPRIFPRDDDSCSDMTIIM